MLKNNLLLSSFLLALPVIGCDGSKDDTGETDTTADDSITPAEGSWYASKQVIEKDTCGFMDDDGDTASDDEPVTLTMSGDSTFNLSDGDGFDMDCALESTGTFTCDAENTVSDYTGDGFDAILTLAQSLSGAFTSSTEGSVTMLIDASCEGKDCDTLSKKSGIAMPCTSSTSFMISHGS
ncbi:MAG: hypothetical protein P8R54_20750 [Myxococcota bacterium]|nr:hypothetical protein [Myxococcota bacterium]